MHLAERYQGTNDLGRGKIEAFEPWPRPDQNEFKISYKSVKPIELNQDVR